MAVVGSIEAKITANIADIQAKLDIVINKLNQTSTASGNLTKSVFSGVAAWDMLKKGIGIATGFIEEGINAAVKASAIMMQVKVNVKNAGLSFEEVGPKIKAYSESVAKLGFDHEETAKSLSSLMLITGDYEKALKLNQLAMDLARSKGMDLAEATQLVTQVTAGGYRGLRLYGINIKDITSSADALNILQKKVKDSAVAFADTSAGKMAAVSVQWGEIKKKVGEELMPVVQKLFSIFEENLPEIEKDITNAAKTITKMGDFAFKAVPFIEDLTAAVIAYVAAVKVAAVATAVQTALQGMTSAAQVATVAWTALNTAIMANPFALIVAEAAAAATAVIHLTNQIKDLYDSVADSANTTANLNVALVKKAHQEVLDAEKTKNATLIAYAKAHQDHIRALVISVSEEERKAIQKRFEDAKKALDADKTASEGWAAIVKGNIEKVGDGLGKLGNDFDGIGVDAKEALEKAAKDAKEALEKAAKDAADAFNKALEEIKDKVLDFSKSLRDLTSKHKEATEKIKSDVTDLTEAYKLANEEREASYDESIAGILKQHEDKAKTLKDQLAEETAFGKDIDEVKIAQTQATLKVEQDFLARHASDRASVASEMAEDEIDKEKKKFEKERATRKTEYDRKLSDLKSELGKEQNAYNEALSDLGVSFAEQWAQMRDYVARTATPEIVSAVNNMVRLANVELAKVGKPLMEALTPTVVAPTAGKVAPSPAALSTIQNTINDVAAKVAALLAQARASGLIPKAQEGGIISKTGLVMAHAGEMITPKGMSPSFNVNFYGGQNFNNKQEQDDFVRKIRDVLMRDFELAKFGIF